MKIKVIFFTFAIVLAAQFSQALQLPLKPNRIGPQTTTFPANFTADYDFEGIVALSNCSGSLIQFEGMSDQNQAYVLTNGHCMEGGFIPPGQHYFKKPSTRTFTLLNPDSSNSGRINATEISYGTMTKTDMAIYKIRETYADIKARFGIRPLLVESKRPVIGDNIEVISGYWKRGYSCSIENFIFELREGRWTWSDSIRYSRPGCEVIGGTSGSPIVRAGTKTVIGINNTGNEDGQRCSDNNPCEVDQFGNISFTKGYSYGQQTHWIYSCLTITSEIDLTKEGCQLPK